MRLTARRTPRTPRTPNGRSARATPRRPLTRARIVGEALGLVASDGLAGLSTRRLGARLGVEAMSIYHHFPSKQHLLDALVDHALSTIAIPLATLGREERLRRLVYEYRAMASRFPRLYPLIALHRLNTPTGVRFIERVLEAVQALAGDAESTARQFRAIGYYLAGAALSETSGYAQGPSAAEPVSDAYIAEHCPLLAAVAPYFKEPHWDATFALGVDALSEGLRSRSGKVRRG